MSNLYQNENGTFNVYAGSDLTATIEDAIQLSAQHNNQLVVFEFNGVIVNILSNSSPGLINRDWYRALQGHINPNVGPYPKPILTEEEKNNAALIQAEQERQAEIQRQEYEARALAKRTTVENLLQGVGPIELTDPDGWQLSKNANRDPYGAAVLTYAERWARLMQMNLAAGESLEAVAEATSQAADLEGITGFMYGAAVSILAQCWKYGDQLRRWHNLKYQLADEGERANEGGGVLNPALLTINLG